MSAQRSEKPRTCPGGITSALLLKASGMNAVWGEALATLNAIEDEAEKFEKGVSKAGQDPQSSS